MDVLKWILMITIILQYIIMGSYQIWIKFPHKRRIARGIMYFITGIALVVVIYIYLSNKSNSDGIKNIMSSLVTLLITLFPLFNVKGNGIRDETKWRQDLKSWISSDLDKSKGKIELRRLLRGSVSPEAIRFVYVNKKLSFKNAEKEIIKPRFWMNPKKEVDNEGKTIGYIGSCFWCEPKFKPENQQTETMKYGRISAIDLYVATKVSDDNISMKDLLDVVSVLLKYDWDYANEKVPMFYWKSSDTTE
ncbi:hypothetical protein WKK_05320 [Weissella koreensis KACC 15510]|uniref:hypothetical protein n=1 Tax=Weissella koreensis TaxID=165096 RepID=UPI0002175048|nr:hypothetical protein [Weissella koreensis]AEJ23935.1 hypothetical protein WKK_05320 [Weissella koreensis KACC 15510]